MIRHDVVEPLYVEVDRIYHLASPASPPHYQYNPIKTIKTNTIGTINLLGLASRVKARFLMASTSGTWRSCAQRRPGRPAARPLTAVACAPLAVGVGATVGRVRHVHRGLRRPRGASTARGLLGPR